MREYDIWNEVLGKLGYEFISDLSFTTCPSSRHPSTIKSIWHPRTCLIYKKDGECVNLYVKFKNGEVTSFLIDGCEYYKTFQNKNKELFRSVKLKYDRQSKLDKLGI